MVNNKRILISMGIGVILGFLCVIGVSGRIPISGNELYFLGMVYNRIIMGFVIGLSEEIKFIENEKLNPVIRGAILGTMVTLAILLSSQAKDNLSFFAGIGYGIIIDSIVTFFIKSE